MSEITLNSPIDTNRRFRFDWVLPALFRPRQMFRRISEAETAVWQTPILILASLSLVRTLVAGGIRSAAAAMGQIELPPGWEYYTPEQQAQFQQAMTATSGPVFTYLLPAIVAILGVYLGWLVLGWLLHLALTLFGGRGSSNQSLNITAWALLPFAIREIIRIVAMWNGGQLLTNVGLSGFASPGEGTAAIVLVSFLATIDLYLFWQIGLLVIGARLVANISRLKTWIAVILVLLIMLALRLAPALPAAQLSDITIIRPFF
jgi:hypothetical protein